MELEARDYVSADAGIVSYTMKTGGGFMIRNPQGNLVLVRGIMVITDRFYLLVRPISGIAMLVM